MRHLTVEEQYHVSGGAAAGLAFAVVGIGLAIAGVIVRNRAAQLVMAGAGVAMGVAQVGQEVSDEVEDQTDGKNGTNGAGKPQEKPPQSDKPKPN